MVELHTNYNVEDVLFSTTLMVLAGTELTCQVKLRSLPEILLHHTVLFLCPSDGVLKSVSG